jgi:hypothetical protein
MSGEKKERVRKECVEKVGENLNLFAKSSDLNMLVFLNCLRFYLCIRRHTLSLII